MRLPKIRFSNLPRGVWQHLLKRVQDREITVADLTRLQEWVKARVGFHAYPRLVEFVTDLPLTTTGKLQRYVLRAQKT